MQAESDRWSKVLFNDVHFLTVSNAVAESAGETSSQDLQKRLGLNQSAVFRVLKDLEEVRLITRLDRASRTEGLRFRREQHAFWSGVQDLYAASDAPAVRS